MPPLISPSAGRRAISTPTSSRRGAARGLCRLAPAFLDPRSRSTGLLTDRLTARFCRCFANGSFRGRFRSPPLARFLARYQHAASAPCSSAAAGKDFVDVGRIFRVAFDLIVVGQLFTGLNGPNGLDVDPLVLRRTCTIRIAAVVDEARLVSSDAAVDHDLGVDREQKGVIVVRILVLVACIRLIVADAIAEV